MQCFVQIGLKMEAGDCPPLNMNAMWAISVKSYLNAVAEHKECFLAIYTSYSQIGSYMIL